MIIKSGKLPLDLNAIQGRCYTDFHWNMDDILSSLCLGDLWVAESKRKNVGFLFSSVVDKSGWVDAVWVNAKERGRGAARKLFAKVHAAYRKRGLKEMRLYVRSDNPAQILYFKLGYRAIAIRAHYFGKKVHAIEMLKSLR